MLSPKIVFWDIETVQNIAATFRLWDRGGLSIPHENVIRERYIVCAAWKELGSSTIHTIDTSDDPIRFAKNPHDDYHVVKTLHDMVSDADVIVAHNGDQYDLPFLKGRAIAHGFGPVAPVMTVDTKKIAKSQFLFNSNRLDYLGKYLGVGRKIETTNSLWLNILTGTDLQRRKAIKDMVRYNKQDVLLLEDVYLKLEPFFPASLVRKLKGDAHVQTCPHCGGTHLQHRGWQRTAGKRYQRFQCMSCSRWSQSTTADRVPKALLKAA